MVSNSRNKEDTSQLSVQMPLFLYEDFDFTFPNAPWLIGLKNTYPAELKRRIATAFVSLQLGLKSLDHTYKRYLSEVDYPEPEHERLDFRIADELKVHMDRFASLLWRVSCLNNKTEGDIIAEWSLLRVPFSMNVLVSCAHKGALFESVAIARTMLEQIAWSFHISTLHDFDEIMNISATKSVTPLGKKFPEAGKFYGWLSSHAHWTYKGHIKSFQFHEQRLVHLFASSEFKAKSFAACLLLSVIAFRVYFYLKKADIEQALMNNIETRGEGIFSKNLLPRNVYDKIGEQIVKEDIYSSDELRELENPTRLHDAFEELEALTDQDEDVKHLRLLAIESLS